MPSFAGKVTSNLHCRQIIQILPNMPNEGVTNEIFSFYWSKTSSQMWWLLKEPFGYWREIASLAAGVLGHGLGSFAHGMFG